jgi:hypothetical protein
MVVKLYSKVIWTRGTNSKTLNHLNFDWDRKPNSAAELQFGISNKSGMFNYFFMPGDRIDFYIGKGKLPASPQFTGFPVEVSGSTNKTVTCLDYLALAKYDVKKLDEFSNYDGWTASAAIRDLIVNLNGTPLTFAGPGPIIDIRIKDTDKIRYPSYADKLSIIGDINELCWDDTYSSFNYHPLPYFFYVSGTTFRHVRQTYTEGATPVLYIEYGDNLISSEPEYSMDYVCNKCTVVGKEYENSLTKLKTHYEASHTDLASVTNLRLFHSVIERDNLESDGECHAEAQKYVQANKNFTVKSAIKHTDGLDLIPGVSVVNIENSRYGISGKHLVAGVNVSGSPGNFEVNIDLTQRKSVITDFL